MTRSYIGRTAALLLAQLDKTISEEEQGYNPDDRATMGLPE